MNDFQNPFSYSLDTYLYVVGLASIAGFVRFLNVSAKTREFHYIILIRDLFTGALAGLMAFWLCEFFGLIGPLSNIAIATAGVMGVKAIDEIKIMIVNILNSYAKK